MELEKEMQKHKIAGIALGIFRNGKMCREHYIGDADAGREKKVDEKTLFEAASLTKPVFTYYAEMLKEQGILEDSVPLAQYLPDYPIQKAKGAEKITARHVLSHSAGLEDWGDKPLRMLFSPGEAFSYSGEGYTYLQRAVEKIRQRALDEIFGTEVFPMLGMKSSCMRYPRDRADQVAAAYDEEGRPQYDRYETRDLEKEPNAAYSLYTNLKDYGSFLEHLWSSGKIFRRMSEAEIKVEEGPGQLYWGQGLGIWKGKKELCWHYGDNGNFKNLFLLDKETGNGFLYFSNSFRGLELGFSIAGQYFEEDFSEMMAFTDRWR